MDPLKVITKSNGYGNKCQKWGEMEVDNVQLGFRERNVDPCTNVAMR